MRCVDFGNEPGSIAAAQEAPTKALVITVGVLEMRNSFMNAPKLLRPDVAVGVARDGDDGLLMLTFWRG